MNQSQSRAPLRNSREQELSLYELWSMLWMGRMLLLGVTAGILALVALVTFVIDPVYESEATLRIRAQQDRAGQLLSQLGPIGDLALPGLGGDEVATEAGVLRSRSIASAVADSLHLSVELLEPGRSRDRVLQIQGTSQGAPEGIFELRRREDGSYSVSARKTRGQISLPPSVELGEPLRLGSLTIALAPALRAMPPEAVRFRVRPFYKVVSDMREELKVGQQEGGSKLIEVSYRHSDPSLAAAVVNGIVGNYVAYKQQTGKSEAHNTIGILRQEVDEYRRRLRMAEEDLRAYQEREEIVAPAEQVVQQVRRLAEVETTVDAMEVERRALANLLAQVGQRAERAGSESAYRQLATYPSFLANEAVQYVLQTLTTLENERTALLARRTVENEDVRILDRRIGELEVQLFRLGNHYLESLDTKIASARQTLAQFRREIGGMPAREMEYARLASEKALVGEVYASLLTRLRQAEVQEAIDPEEVRVIDRGLVPEEPVFPKPLVNVVLGTILGLMLGMAAVVGREMTNTKVRSQADAESATDGLPVLGKIPPLPFRAEYRNGTSGRQRIRVPRVVPLFRNRVVEGDLITHRDPWSPVAEAYRALATALTVSAGERSTRVLVITSALPGDGKSTVAANLAVTFAQRGTRTLLVDADLRNGRLHRLLGVDAEPGLIELLSGQVPEEQAVREMGLDGPSLPLSVLPSGHRPQHPGRLISAEGLRPLLEALRAHHELIILDAPPLHLVADGILLGTLADTSLLVARHGVTERAALEHAAATLRRSGVRVEGVVLNEVTHMEEGSYQYLQYLGEPTL